MSKQFEELKAKAESMSNLLENIAGFDSCDIDGDSVDLRFEDENGCDTGADISIVETSRAACDVIDELLAALEEKDQRIAELETIASEYAAKFQKAQDAVKYAHIMSRDDKTRIAELEAGHSEAGKQINSWRTLAKQNIAEREKDIAALDVARQRIAELESEFAFATNQSDEYFSQLQKAEQDSKELEGSLGVANAATQAWKERAKASEQRLQQPIKLPKREIGMACEFVSDHIVVSLAAVLAEATTAGFKVEGE